MCGTDGRKPVDLRKLLEILEERRDAYRKTWRRLSRSDKIFVIALIGVGIVNVAIGSIMLWQ